MIVPPTPVLVNIVNGSSALAVLEGAVDIDRGYRFTATYFGNPLGYLIEAINGTASEFPCFWFFYIQEPGGQPEFSQVGVSNYVVPDSGYSVIFRYEIFDETEPGHSPNGAKSYLPTITNLLLLGCIALLFNYIWGTVLANSRHFCCYFLKHTLYYRISNSCTLVCIYRLQLCLEPAIFFIQ